MREPARRPAADTIVIRLPARRNGAAVLLLRALAVVVAALAGLLLLGVLALAGAYAYYQNAGRIIPGVSAGAVRLDGMTVNEAAVVIEKTWGLETRITADSGLYRQELTPDELGIRIEPYVTARRAYEIGHIGSLLARSAQIFASLKDGWPVTPAVSLDARIAAARLEALVPAMSQPAQNASLRVDGGVVIPVPAQVGYTIHMETTLAALQAEPEKVLMNGRLPVSLRPVLPDVDDVTPALAEAQRILATPFTLTVYDPIADQSQQFQASPEELGQWLAVTPDASGPRLSLDPARVAAYLEQVSGQLDGGRFLDAAREAPEVANAFLQGRQPVATVHHAPTTYVVQPGDTLLKIGWNAGMPFWKIQRANPQIDPEQLSAGMELTIPSRDELLPLPVVPHKRIEISISKQRMRVIQDGQVIHQYRISTGIDRSPTQPGVFQVQSRDAYAYASVWDLYMPHFLGIYEAWPGFMNGIHGLPTLSNGQQLWGNILGSPASYGCIILDLPEAEWLYNWAEDGVVVEIKP